VGEVGRGAGRVAACCRARTAASAAAQPLSPPPPHHRSWHRCRRRLRRLGGRPAAVGNVLPVALGHDRACQTQRVSDIAVTLTTMCYDSSLSDNHRDHCAIAPPREAPSLRLRQSDSRVCASLCDSVPVCSDSALPESVATSDRRVGGDPESPTPDPESPTPGPRVRRRDPAGWPGFHVSDSSKRGHLQPSPTGLQRCTGGCSGAQVAASGSVALRQLRVRYSLRGLRCGDASAGHGSGGTTAALRRQWPRERDGPAPTRADVNGAAMPQHRPMDRVDGPGRLARRRVAGATD
jgi:hypothetical protein